MQIPPEIIEKAIGCLKCGNPTKEKEDSYCSLKCWYEVLRKPRPKCLVCGNLVKAHFRKLCSVSCSNRWKYKDPKNHPSWKGGRKTWLIHIRNKNWRPLAQWREKVLFRDGYKCVLCGVSEGTLEADHIKPFRFFPELHLELSNGRTLCQSCHRATPTYGRKLNRIYDLLLTNGDTKKFWEDLLKDNK